MFPLLKMEQSIKYLGIILHWIGAVTYYFAKMGQIGPNSIMNSTLSKTASANATSHSPSRVNITMSKKKHIYENQLSFCYFVVPCIR